MEKKKVLIVDDSPFSRSVLMETLTAGDFEITGEAGNLEEALTLYRQTKPDLVTMDIAMPGADGLECTRALKMEDPEAKVVLVSSMKDELLLREAKLLNVAGYIQKPFEDHELISALQAIFQPEQEFEQLSQVMQAVFTDALADGIKRVTKTTVKQVQKDVPADHFVSAGIAVIVGITGKYSGRMIMDLSFSTAEKMAQAALKRAPKSEDEVLAMVSEFANIISGNSCSQINRLHSEFALRVAPPSIMRGISPEIVSLHLAQKVAVQVETEFGSLYLNIGFKRGLTRWM